MSRSRLIALIMGVCVIGDSMLYVTLPPSYQDLGLDNATTGLILSVNRFSRLAFNPLAAMVIGRLGYRATAILCSLMAITCTLGYSFVQAPWAWLLLRVMWGLTWSLIRLTAMLITLEEASDSTKGQALGSMQRLVRIGSVTGTFVGGYLLDRMGFRQTALVLGLVTSVSILLAVSLKNSAEPRTTPLATGKKSSDRATGAFGGAVTCFRQGSYVYLSTLLSAVAVGGIFLSTTGVLVKARLAGQATALVFGVAAGAGSISGTVQSFRWLSDILFAPTVGRLSDRLGRHLPMASVYAIQCLAGVLILSTSSMSATVVASSLLYVAQSLALVILSSAAADLKGATHASVSMTLYSSCLDLGEAIGPVLAYNLLGFGLFRSYTLGSFVLGGLGTVWGYMAIRRRALSQASGS